MPELHSRPATTGAYARTRSPGARNGIPVPGDWQPGAAQRADDQAAADIARQLATVRRLLGDVCDSCGYRLGTHGHQTECGTP